MDNSEYTDMMFEAALDEGNPQQLTALDEVIAIVGKAIENLEKEIDND